MSTVVVTGGTRGIGLGLVRALLSAGHRVACCGTDPAAVARLARELPESGRAVVADVTDRDQVRTLWQTALDAWGPVDVWINNAGVAHRRAPLWQLSAAEVETVLAVNLRGVLNGCAVAIEGMAAHGRGHVWNMEGLGSDGRRVPGLALYGASKRALTYLTLALARELPDGVSVGLLSPGMVATDLLTHGYSPAELARMRKVFNILADRVDTVAPWLAERAISQARNGAHVRWLTPAKVAARFALAPVRHRDIFPPDPDQETTP